MRTKSFSSHFFNSSNVTMIFLFGLGLGLVKADPDPLQDYCVADTKTRQSYSFNGLPCLDPKLVLSSHFSTPALSKPGNTRTNPFGFNVTLTNIQNLPGINTQGLAMARVDIEANGLVPPHSHPRASEVTICLQGQIIVGFVTTTNHMYTQQLRTGESFVFPKGLIHFMYNMDQKKPALAISGLSSQNPGAQIVSLATFASIPAMPDEVLEGAFQINRPEVAKIRKNLGG